MTVTLYENVKKSTVAESANEENAANSSPATAQDGEVSANPDSSDVASLMKVMEGIRDFRKDTKQQLNDIKSELTTVI